MEVMYNRMIGILFILNYNFDWSEIMLVHQLWERHADDSVIYRYHNESITYGDLKVKVNEVKNYFHSIGIKSGENCWFIIVK